MDAGFDVRLRDFSCGLFFMFQILGTAALCIKGRHHRLQRSAFHFMLYLFGISLFEFYVFFINNFLGDLEVPLTDILQMSVVPLALLFLYRLTHSDSMRLLPSLLNVAPYYIALILYAVHPSEFIYDGIMAVALIHSLSIIAYGFVAVRNFNKRLAANFSSDDNLSLRWMWLFLLLYIALAITWLVATQSSSEIMAAFYNVMCSVILGLLCYFVYRQEDMLEVLEANKNGTVSDEKGNDTGKSPDYHFADNFEKVFCEHHIYLDPALNINGLARELGTNRTYISNFLNQQMHTTFYEYVNQWRVKRAKELLAESGLPLEQIAEKSGFNSLSSFRRYFTKAVGMTPAKYRKAKLLQASAM